MRYDLGGGHGDLPASRRDRLGDRAGRGPDGVDEPPGGPRPLDDRFRLLSGGRRGLERHQTLRQAVQWSYDLLDDDERAVLGRCSVFADGFDLDAAISRRVRRCDDDYVMLDLVDSLVRKSLVTVEQANGPTRYGMLETIRQFAEDQLATTAPRSSRSAIATPLLRRDVAPLGDLGRAPPTRVARLGDAEFANLRASSAGQPTRRPRRAAAIAAHAAIMSWPSSGSSRWLGRGDPRAVVDADLAATAAPLRRRQPLPLRRAARRRRRLRRDCRAPGPIRATTRSSMVGAACCRRSPISSVVASTVAWRSVPSWRRGRASPAWSGSAVSPGRCRPSGVRTRPSSSPTRRSPPPASTAARSGSAGHSGDTDAPSPSRTASGIARRCAKGSTMPPPTPAAVLGGEPRAGRRSARSGPR